MHRGRELGFGVFTERDPGGLPRRGHTAKQVGRELGLSPATVVTYKNRIFKKCQVASLKEFLLKTPSPAARERIGLSC